MCSSSACLPVMMKHTHRAKEDDVDLSDVTWTLPQGVLHCFAVLVFVDTLRLTSISSFPYLRAANITFLPGIPHPLTHTQAPRVVLCCHRLCTATDQPMPPWRRPLLCPSLMTCPRLCSRLPSSLPYLPFPDLASFLLRLMFVSP